MAENQLAALRGNLRACGDPNLVPLADLTTDQLLRLRGLVRAADQRRLLCGETVDDVKIGGTD